MASNVKIDIQVNANQAKQQFESLYSWLNKHKKEFQDKFNLDPKGFQNWNAMAVAAYNNAKAEFERAQAAIEQTHNRSVNRMSQNQSEFSKKIGKSFGVATLAVNAFGKVVSFVIDSLHDADPVFFEKIDDWITKIKGGIAGIVQSAGGILGFFKQWGMLLVNVFTGQFGAAWDQIQAGVGAAQQGMSSAEDLSQAKRVQSKAQEAYDLALKKEADAFKSRDSSFWALNTEVQNQASLLGNTIGGTLAASIVDSTARTIERDGKKITEKVGQDTIDYIRKTLESDVVNRYGEPVYYDLIQSHLNALGFSEVSESTIKGWRGLVDQIKQLDKDLENLQKHRHTFVTERHGLSDWFAKFNLEDISEITKNIEKLQSILKTGLLPEDFDTKGAGRQLTRDELDSIKSEIKLLEDRKQVLLQIEGTTQKLINDQQKWAKQLVASKIGSKEYNEALQGLAKASYDLSVANTLPTYLDITNNKMQDAKRDIKILSERIKEIEELRNMVGGNLDQPNLNFITSNGLAQYANLVERIGFPSETDYATTKSQLKTLQDLYLQLLQVYNSILYGTFGRDTQAGLSMAISQLNELRTKAKLGSEEWFNLGKQIGSLNRELKDPSLLDLKEIVLDIQADEAIAEATKDLKGFAEWCSEQKIDVKLLDEEGFKSMLETYRKAQATIEAGKEAADTLKNAYIAALEEAISATEGAGQAFGATAQLVENCGNAMGVSAQDSKELRTALIALTIAEQAAAVAAALLTVAKGGDPYSLPARVIAAAASVVGAIAASRPTTHKFAEGGIVSGQFQSGDLQTIRVNAGEMVLTTQQQKNLFSMLNNGGVGGGGQVEFTIKGKDLVGVLNNTNKYNSLTK